MISLSLEEDEDEEDEDEEEDVKNEEYIPGFSEPEESKSVPKASSSDLLLRRVFGYSKIMLEEVVAGAAAAAGVVILDVDVDVDVLFPIEKLYEGIIPSCIVPGIIWKLEMELKGEI